MKDTQLYSQILGIQKPWKVTSVNVSLAGDENERDILVDKHLAKVR